VNGAAEPDPPRKNFGGEKVKKMRLRTRLIVFALAAVLVSGSAIRAGASPAPAQMGVCRVDVDNWTQWKVQVYVDGTFRGMVSPWGDGTTYTGAGPTRVYVRAEFTDGTYKYWGPRNYDCYGGQRIYFRLDQ
jgi:hypothetical protein